MNQLVISRRAIADLQSIWDYSVERGSLRVATRYIADIKDVFQRLASRPGSGVAIDDIRSGYFRCFCGSHTTYYTVRDDQAVVIQRILHQRMDPDANL